MSKIQSSSPSIGLSATYDLEKETVTTMVYSELYDGDNNGKTQIAFVSASYCRKATLLDNSNYVCYSNVIMVYSEKPSHDRCEYLVYERIETPGYYRRK